MNRFKTKTVRLIGAFSLALFLLAPVLGLHADEGMFLLNQLPMERLQALGFQLTPEQIYRPGGGGLSDAVVMVGGGTGAFVSPDGLILTNHHVAFAAIQMNSSPEHNYIKEGFWAKTRQEELPAPGYECRITLSFQDITPRVLHGIKKKWTGLKRYKAIEKRIKEIEEKESDEKAGIEAQVVSMYDGMYYYLFKYLRIKDVRLVYAPPEAIGQYGGDTDNWMWPRHAGDFSFMRAYVGPDGKPADYSPDNVPFHSKTYLPISTAGVKEGDFMFIMGYPGRTMRYRTSYSVRYNQKISYPYRIQLFKEMIQLLNRESEKDSSLKIKFASMEMMLSNVLKNNEGMLEGLKKSHLLERKLAMEKQLTDFLNRNPELQKAYGGVLPAIGKLYAQQEKWDQRETLLRFMAFGSRMYGFASTIYQWSVEKKKPNLERDPRFLDRNIPQIKQRMKIAQRDLHPPTDAKMLELFLLKLANLPEDQQVGPVVEILKRYPGKTKAEAIHEYVQEVYSGTKLADLDTRLKMMDMSYEELMAQNDPLIALAAKLSPVQKQIQDWEQTFAGQLSVLRPKFIEALTRWKKANLYPDANRTIRFTYGTVKGYEPRDAVIYKYITTLRGVLEKDTGKEPFNCPPKLRQLEENRDFGRYEDPLLRDVPVDFLGTTDITGGNSGSPVMNAKGEYIGIAFDGNYESMTSDWQFDPRLTRTISVDARYILFILDKFFGAKNILEELTVH